MTVGKKHLWEMEPNFHNILLDVNTALPQWIFNIETQAVVLAGLCCVGAWVIFQWMIQIIFSVIWPFFAVVAVMIFLPSWRKFLVTEYLPKYVQTIRSLTRRFTDGFNCTVLST